jgi:hypothetical protein
MLLDEIIDLLGNEQSSLTDVLLKTKVLLHQIGHKDLASWVNSELNGYPDGTTVPEYRIIPSQVLANFANISYRYTSHPIPIGHLTDDQQETLTKTRMWQSLPVIEEMISSNKEGRLIRTIPLELNRSLGKGLHPSFQIERAWCEFSVPDVKGICTQVRSRLLDFMLELKDTVGQTTTESELREKISSFDAQGMFNSAIFGPNTTILIGHQSSITATQTATFTASELAERVRELVEKVEPLLPTSGLPRSVREDAQGALAELREAAAATIPDVSRLRRGLESLKRVMEHAAGHVVATGALALIAELLSRAAH